MAIIGQGVQAGLGRVDYTPYLQGAMAGSQGIAQGISSVGQSAAQGIRDYAKNKEEERAATTTIKTSESLIKGLRSLADQKDAKGNPLISPEIKASLDQFAATISDPGLSSRDRARAAQQGIQQFSGLINAGLTGAQTTAQLGQVAAQTTLLTNQAAKLAADLEIEKNDNKALSGALKSIIDQGEDVSPTSLIKGYINQGGSVKGLESLRNVLPQPKGGSKIEKYDTTENGIPLEITIETFPDGTRKELGRIRKDVPAGYRGTETGGVTPIVGSKEAVAREEKDKAFQQSYESGLAQAQVMLKSIAGAKDIIKNYPVSVQGIGSTTFGWLPAAKSLEGYYRTIGTNTALTTIREARKESPTGGNPFGQLNAKEFEGAASVQGSLNRDLEDKVALQNMDQIASSLLNAYPQLRDQYQYVLETEQKKLVRALKGAPKSKVSSGFEIIGVSP